VSSLPRTWVGGGSGFVRKQFARPFDVGGLGRLEFPRPFDVQYTPLRFLFHRAFNVIGPVGTTFARPFDVGTGGLLLTFQRPFDVIDESDGQAIDYIVHVPSQTERVNAVQRLTVQATGGTYTLTFDGQTTAPIAWDATAGTIQAALEALSNIAPGDVVVTDG
jgi:hypothetical protein